VKQRESSLSSSLSSNLTAAHDKLYINPENRMKLASAAGLRVAQCGVVRHAMSQARFASTTTKSEPAPQSQDAAASTKKKEAMDKLKKTHKSMAELDEEMKQAMETMSGEGGEYGLELEGGKPVAMKRSVKENMFRYI
jgi:superoxide dismutase